MIDTGSGEGCRYYEHPLNWNSQGVGGVFAISGQVDEVIDSGAPIPANDPEWQFVATTATVTITNTHYCVQNYGENLNNNNWANGYVEVVDGLPNISGVSQDSSRVGDLKKH